MSAELTQDERDLIAVEVMKRATSDGITTPLLAEGVLAAVAHIKADAFAEGWNRAYADMHETPPECDGSCGERDPHGLHHEPLA